MTLKPLFSTKFAFAGLLSIGLAGGVWFSNNLGWAAPAVKPTKAATKSASKTDKKKDDSPPINKALYASVESLSLVKTPKDFIGKKVQFKGTFSGFSGLGLDYPKALREAKNYVNLLVRRPDVTKVNIPMGELKLFYPRKKSDAVKELNVGDQVLIYGQVFSAALKEPWVDVDKLEITAHTGKPEHAKDD